MADIFISYAREDRPRVEPLAKALEDRGWSVFWDRTIPAGKTWRQVIGEALGTARSVIVVWSKASVESRWVQEEADRGLERNILIPLLIDNVIPPLGFGAIQAADLINWESTQSSPEFEKLIYDLSAILGPSPLKVRETEKKRAEEEVKHRKDEERDRRKKKQWKAEEEHKQKEAEEKSISEDERKRREEKAKIKPDKTGPDATAPSKPKSPEPHKTSNALKFGAVAGVIVLLMTAGWFFYKYQQEQQKKENRIKLERFYEQVEELERSVAKVDDQEQLKGLYRQRDKLSNQFAAFSEQAIKVGLVSQMEQLQDRLNKFDTQLANKENELIAARKGKIFVASAPDNATVKILNIDQGFQQGMELEPGKYHVQVSSEGYEPQDKWTEIGPGEEKRISFELKKIAQKGGKIPEQSISYERQIGTRLPFVDFDEGALSQRKNKRTDFFFKSNNPSDLYSMYSATPYNGAAHAPNSENKDPRELASDEFLKRSGNVPINTWIPCLTSDAQRCDYKIEARRAADERIMIEYKWRIYKNSGSETEIPREFYIGGTQHRFLLKEGFLFSASNNLPLCPKPHEVNSRGCYAIEPKYREDWRNLNNGFVADGRVYITK